MTVESRSAILKEVRPLKTKTESRDGGREKLVVVERKEVDLFSNLAGKVSHQPEKIAEAAPPLH